MMPQQGPCYKGQRMKDHRCTQLGEVASGLPTAVQLLLHSWQLSQKSIALLHTMIQHDAIMSSGHCGWAHVVHLAVTDASLASSGPKGSG